MAPEYIVHGQLTEKADIYSYGVLVLEIVTGRSNTSCAEDQDGSSNLLSYVVTTGSIARIFHRVSFFPTVS